MLFIYVVVVFDVDVFDYVVQLQVGMYVLIGDEVLCEGGQDCGLVLYEFVLVGFV